MNHPMFKQSVKTAVEQAEKQILDGAKEVKLSVMEWEDGTRVAIRIEPEF